MKKTILEQYADTAKRMAQDMTPDAYAKGLGLAALAQSIENFTDMLAQVITLAESKQKKP